MGELMEAKEADKEEHRQGIKQHIQTLLHNPSVFNRHINVLAFLPNFSSNHHQTGAVSDALTHLRSVY